jgi:2-polyprenyl-3-methyl-5-hydroxy-6-metoxy-1,4-benzoquinol methylase
VTQGLPDYVFSEFRVYPGDRPDLVRRLPGGLGRVLDFGCGPGGLGEALVAAGKATSVVGVDLNPDAVAQAARRLESAHVLDLDRSEVQFPAESFDTLLYADVLEHLKYPWNVVRSQRLLLRPGGRAYCSAPNVGHFRVLSRLLRQRWEYETEGIFDYTHLRFFTRSSLAAMFRAASYRQVVCKPLERLSLKARMFNRLTLGVAHDFTVRSWWIEART